MLPMMTFSRNGFLDYTVRHPIKSEDRLKSLLRLLIIRLGKRTQKDTSFNFYYLIRDSQR